MVETQSLEPVKDRAPVLDSLPPDASLIASEGGSGSAPELPTPAKGDLMSAAWSQVLDVLQAE
jgi:hypothetical protein